METRPKHKGEIVRVFYYPRDIEQKSQREVKKFDSMRKAKAWVKQAVETAEICSFYSIQKECDYGQ